MVPAVIFLIVIVLVRYYAKAREKRQQQMRLLAESMGLQLVPITMPSGCLSFGLNAPKIGALSGPAPTILLPKYLEQFQKFYPFGMGGSRSIENLMEGRREDLNWSVFDYRYTVSSGKSSSTYLFTIVTAEAPIVFPRMSIQRQGFFQKIGEMMSGTDVHFESEEFNKKFSVYSDDRKLAYDLIHPETMEFLMGVPEVSWQFFGQRMLVAIQGVPDAQQITHACEQLQNFWTLVPGYVKQDRLAGTP